MNKNLITKPKQVLRQLTMQQDLKKKCYDVVKVKKSYTIITLLLKLVFDKKTPLL